MRNFLEDWIAILRGRGNKVYRIIDWDVPEVRLVRIATAIAAALVLYLVGLFAQLINNYKAYMASGGYYDGEMPKTSFAPYKVFGHLFSSGGFAAIIIVVVAVVAIYLLTKYKDIVFGTGDYDERGFRKTKDGLYGTADWMTEKEAKEIFEIGGIRTVRGDILGEKDGRLYCLPEDTRFNRHKMIIGASGTMKSRAIVRNHIFQAIMRGESVGITDPKGEMFADCYELFKKNDYNVKVLNLVNPEHGNRWNCMSDLNGDTMLAQVLTNVIIGNTTDGKGDQFWDNGERNLLKALILYVDYSKEIPPEEKSLAKVYEILTSCSDRELYRMFDELDPGHPAKVPYNLFSRADDKVKSGFILGLGTRLQVLQVDAVKTLVSGNDIDLTSLGKEKTAFFVILPDQDTTMKFISSLFFSLMFISLTKYADAQPNRKCAVPVNLILDEFNNVGRLGGAEDGSDFARTLSVIRSRDVRITIAIQSLGQLQNRYPNNLWAELQGNCDLQLMLGCTDDITAEYVSERSGEMTVEVDSTRHSRKTFSPVQVVTDYQKTEGKGKRTVLTKDEVLRLEREKLLVIARGYNLLKLNKWDYLNHPMSKEIREVSIFDYYSDGVDYASVEKKEMEEAAKKAEKYADRTPPDGVTHADVVEVALDGFTPPEEEPPIEDGLGFIFGGIVDSNASYGSGNSHFDTPMGYVSADDDAHVNPAAGDESYDSYEPYDEDDDYESDLPDTFRGILHQTNKEFEEKKKKKRPAYEDMEEECEEGYSKPESSAKIPTGYKLDKSTGEVYEDRHEDKRPASGNEVKPEVKKVPEEQSFSGQGSRGDESPKQGSSQKQDAGKAGGNKPPKYRSPNRPGASARNPITVSQNSDDITGF